MDMLLRAFLISAALLLVVSCGGSDAEDNVVAVHADDTAMKAAIEKARATVGTFQEALRSPSASRSAFSLKARFEEGDVVEHMWLDDVSFDGKAFSGAVNNDPEELRNVSFGQKVTVPPGEISDWMFVENGKLVGGFTIRVMRDSLSTEEREAMDASLPFKIE